MRFQGGNQLAGSRLRDLHEFRKLRHSEAVHGQMSHQRNVGHPHVRVSGRDDASEHFAVYGSFDRPHAAEQEISWRSVELLATDG
jgi:hypothetical protein